MKMVFIDTNAFFKARNIFENLIDKGYELVTSTIVIYEFIKVIDELIREEKSEEKKKLYLRIKNRFPKLLKELNVKILSHNLSYKDVEEAMEMSEKKNVDIGDALIFKLIKSEGIRNILTYDKDWKRFSVNIIR